MDTEQDDEKNRFDVITTFDDDIVGSPLPPATMTADEVDLARRQATEMVRELRESTGARQMAVIDDVTSLGLHSQRNAGRQLELVKTRLSTLLDGGAAGREVATDLVDLRAALDRINPVTEQQSLWARTVGVLPFMRDNVMVRALKRIALRYETVSTQITVIETRLHDGRSLLARDNVELRRLYEDVEAQQDAVSRQQFLGALLLRELEQLLEQIEEPLQRDRIQAAVHDVAMRLQDLHVMQEVHLQYFISIDVTRQNNNRLGQAVDRTLMLATNVVTIGLAIQAALVRQRSVQEATERTREFLGEVITQNAAAIRKQTEEIGDLYNEPVIAMDKLVQAHQDLLAALDLASRLRHEGVITAKRNIDELTGMTRELSTHVHGLEDDGPGDRR
jgi:uncharacterized protein YaaN involved in tellurite resistance